MVELSLIGFPNAPIGKFLSASPIFLIDTTSRKFGNGQSASYYPTAWKRNSPFGRRTTPHASKSLPRTSLPTSRGSNKEKWSRRWFQEGLETSRVEVALLKIWTAIEALCAREEREPTQRVVERAISIFDNFRHAAMRLNFIQDYRNRVVHRGEAGDHALLCAQYGTFTWPPIFGSSFGIFISPGSARRYWIFFPCRLICKGSKATLR